MVSFRLSILLLAFLAISTFRDVEGRRRRKRADGVDRCSGHFTKCTSDPSGCCKKPDSGEQTTQAPAATTQASNNNPTTAGSGKNGKPKKGKTGGGHCFSGDDTVITDVGVMKMSELVGKNNIKVLSRNSMTEKLELSPVTYWIHADHSRNIKFLSFSTESGHKLLISHLHLIYETDCAGASSTVFAKKVQKDNCVYVKNEADGRLVESKVIDIEEVEKTGIYAPITQNGNIVVNDVLASCFAEHEDENLQKLSFSLVMWAKSYFELVFPKSFVNTLYSTPFASYVEIPEFLFSLIDLSKTFVR